MDTGSPFRDAPSSSRRRFQFNLRSMLALTALVAWMLGWMGLEAVFGLIILSLFTLIEAGCTRGANLVDVLVRNLFAFFVCSLVFGAVGFGLMYGKNPTGWIGTDQFLFAPFRAPIESFSFDEFDPSDSEDRARFRAHQLREGLKTEALFCALAAVIAHRVLAGRARLPAYLLLWVGMAGLVYPLMGAWLRQDYFAQDEGWLVRAGFSTPTAGSVFTFQCAAGVACLAGAIVLRSGSEQEKRRLGLLSPNCHHLLVSLGLGTPVAFFLIALPIGSLFARPPGPEEVIAIVGLLGPVAGGLITATAGCYLWRRRFHWPLTLAGGFGAFLALMVAVPGIPSPIWRGAVGLVAGALVVLTSYLFERLDSDDPGGAVAVHAVCGAWAALSIGLQTLLPDSWLVALAPSWYAANPPEDALAKQLLGVGVCVSWVFITSAALFWLIRRSSARADKPPVAPNSQCVR